MSSRKFGGRGRGGGAKRFPQRDRPDRGRQSPSVAQPHPTTTTTTTTTTTPAQEPLPASSCSHVWADAPAHVQAETTPTTAVSGLEEILSEIADLRSMVTLILGKIESIELKTSSCSFLKPIHRPPEITSPS